MASAETRAAGPSGSQPTLKKDLFQVNADLYTAVSLWLKKHGKGVKPKLSDEQKQQMKECFELMDQDGSGAIDAEELSAAFKLLGIKMKRAELAALLAEVDHDGSGEVEYPEFLEIMTVTLQRLAEEEDGEKIDGQVPFGLMATAYRRKRLMEGIINGHKEVQAQIQQISDKANLEALQATKAAEMEAMRAKGLDGGAGGGSNTGMAGGGRTSSGRPLRRACQADVNKALLDALGPDERRIVSSLTAKAQPVLPRSPPPPIGLMGASRPYGHFANSPSHRQLMDTPQLLDLRFVHQSTIKLPPGAASITRSMSGLTASGMGGGGGGGGAGGGGGPAGYVGGRDNTSYSGAAAPLSPPPIGITAAAMRVTTPPLGTRASLSGALNSPGRNARSDDSLPHLRNDGGGGAGGSGGGSLQLPRPGIGQRLGTFSARHERVTRER